MYRSMISPGECQAVLVPALVPVLVPVVVLPAFGGTTHSQEERSVFVPVVVPVVVPWSPDAGCVPRGGLPRGGHRSDGWRAARGTREP